MITRELILSDIEFYKSIEKRYDEKLNSLSDVKVLFRKQHGKPRPYAFIDGAETYINKRNSHLVDDFIRRQNLELSLSLIKGNRHILENAFSFLRDPYEIIPHNLASINHKDYSSVVSQLDSLKCGRPGFSNRHITSTGIEVKSKSELLLFEFFISKGLDVYYESPTFIDNQVWYPDFTIVRKSDGKKILWEHFGLMNDPEYRSNAINKIEIYCRNGYMPCKDIVYSYDNDDGTIDMGEVARLLEMMQLI